MELPLPLTPDDWQVIHQQRVITAQINKEVVKVGAIFLRSTSKIPVNDNWADSKYLDTNLQSWVDDDTLRYSNVGFNLQQGWVDVDVDGDDSEYNRCIYSALNHVGIDTRLAFGRMSFGVPRHFLVQLPEEESRSFDELKKFEPREIRLKDLRFRTELRSTPVGAKGGDAKQTVVPGSLYGKDNRYDVSVWWDEHGSVAKTVQQVAQTSNRITTFDEVLRAIAFGTIL